MGALDNLFGLRRLLLNGAPIVDTAGREVFSQTFNLLGGWTVAIGEDDDGKMTLEIAPPGGGGGGTGDVVGPATAVADRVAVFNGTTGKLIKDGGSTIASILASALAAAQAYANTVGAAVTALIPAVGGSPADVTKAAASGGALSTYARSDHKHDVATAAAGAFSVSGVVAAEGTSTSLARADHAHSLVGRLPFANLVAATAGDKVVGSTAAGSFQELGLSGGVERNGTNLQVSSQLPARGTENVVVDLWPSTQAQGTLATASSVNFDVAIASGKRYKIVYDVYVDDGAGGACLFAKAVSVVAHQTGGAAVIITNDTLHDNAGAGFTFTVTVSTTNVRGTLSSTFGSTKTYNLVAGYVSLDKP